MWKNRCVKFEYSARAYFLFSNIKLNHRIDVYNNNNKSREVAPAVAFSFGRHHRCPNNNLRCFSFEFETEASSVLNLGISLYFGAKLKL